MAGKIMSATSLLPPRNGLPGANHQQFESKTLTLFSRIGVEPRECRCPSCGSIVYTRRHKVCGACDETLPDHCLFTDEEAWRVSRLVITERNRHRAWLRRAEAV